MTVLPRDNHVHKLVCCEQCSNVRDAIAREKVIKGWTRKKKNDLVETVNPEWKDITNLQEDT